MSDLIQSFCIAVLSCVMAFQAWWFNVCTKEIRELLRELRQIKNEYASESQKTVSSDTKKEHEPLETNFRKQSEREFHKTFFDKQSQQ